MKKVLIIFIALITFLAGQAQITVTVGTALLQNPGTNVQLPVSVKGINGTVGGIGITGLELHMSYMNTSLVYDTTLNFSNLTPGAQWFYGANGNDYGTNWLEPNGISVNIPDNTVLFNISFHYLGGITELIFDSTRCLLIDSAYNIIPGVHYTNGRVTPSSGSTESRWNGTGTWNTVSDWSNGIPGDQTSAIIESGEPTVLSNALCKSIVINQGTGVNIAPDFSLTAESSFVNNGIMTVQSNETGTGSIIVNGTVSGTGVNNFQRFLDFNSNPGYFISSPVLAPTALIFGSHVVEQYAESSASWTALTQSDILESGEGYRISGSLPETFVFQGLFGVNDVSLNNLSYNATGSANTRGLNLLGNPYPSAIQLEQGNWSRTNLDKAVYVWDGYKYVSWNGSVGSLTNGIIPSMQGFFVKANGAGASITIPSGSRLVDTQHFYKSEEALSNVISMRLENIADTSHYDEAFVQISAGSSSGFDSQYDAYMIPGNSNYPHIFTKASDQNLLSINTQPAFVTVPVEFTTGSAGTYKITFGKIESFDANQTLYFEDKSTSTAINIRNTGVFVFSSDGSGETDRFALHFQEVGINDHTQTDFFTWNTGHTIHISAKTGVHTIDHMDLFNLTGQCVLSTGNLNLPATIHQDNLCDGLYILKMTTREGIFTQKIVIR